MTDTWTQDEQQVLLDALCEGVNIPHVIEIVLEKTKYSESQIRQRLVTMGAIEERID